MDQEDLDAFRDHLLEMRRSIAGDVAQLTQVGFSLGTDGAQDVGDDAANTYARQVLLGLGERERAILREIDKALDRIDDGSFALCQECGDEIGRERLRAIPYASLCIDCKALEEQQSRS